MKGYIVFLDEEPHCVFNYEHKAISWCRRYDRLSLEMLKRHRKIRELPTWYGLKLPYMFHQHSHMSASYREVELRL